MTKALLALRAGAFAACLVAASASWATAADRCAAPEEITADLSPLPHVKAALQGGSTLNILTVGSATVFSPDETLKAGTVTGMALGVTTAARPGELPMPSGSAFPLQTAHILRSANPGVTINVTVRGGRGMTATDMVDIIQKEVSTHQYQLVIWQTGTVEAVRNVPVREFYQTLQSGAAAIAAANADLIFVDPQYSRFLRSNADLDPYTQALQQIASMPGAMLFHRFDLMRYWVSDGQIDLERTPKADRLPTVEALHACLGERLAHMIMDAAHQPS